MADWDTTFRDTDVNSSPVHSRQSSQSSGLSSGNKENHDLTDSDNDIILRGGGQLREESLTESAYENASFKNGITDLAEIPPRSKLTNGSPGTAKARAMKSPFAPSTIDSIPEEEVTIPADGNLSAYTADQMANFFRCLKIDDRIISHLHRKNVDGKRFARLKESELEAVGMKTHPVILFFKDRSSAKTKNKGNGWSL